MNITVLNLNSNQRLHPDLKWLYEPVATRDEEARSLAKERQAQLTKPPGSLGELETLALNFAGWQGTARPTLDNIRVRVFAGDHGIINEGVSAFPQAVTAQMIHNFARGGAAISVLAKQHDAGFSVVNLSHYIS